MKQETNNEMDLLLRRLGRRDDVILSGVADDHLDPDELNAYAENALPAAARARYTMHLAECSRCRSLVVQLSSSAGAVATTESAAVPEPSGFRKFLANLFTPMVLRYAAPAVGLIVVAVIGFVVLRSNQPAQYVVQDTAQQRPVAAPTAQSSESFGNSALKTTPSTTGRVEKQAKDQQAQPAPPPNMPPVVDVETNLSKDKAAAQPKSEERPATANEPPPAKPEPSATPEQSQRAAEPEVARNEVKELPVNSRTAERALREDRKKDNDNFARARRPTDSVSAATSGSAGGIQRDDAGNSNATRSVAGRSFRREGGVWIDTAYDSSKNVVTLTRGSEQYRALVADEPAIKNIADQLDGEILVVWKTRTYRIR